jgi:sensor histidine kinase YesM
MMKTDDQHSINRQYKPNNGYLHTMIQRAMRINFSDKRVIILLHIIMWIAILSLPFIQYNSDRHRVPGPPSEELRLAFLHLSLLNNLVWIVIFYLNSILLIPRLATPKKWTAYTISIFILFFFALGVNYLLVKTVIHDGHYNFIRSITFSLPPFILAILSSSLWQIWRDKTKTAQLLQQQKEENLKTELSFLRSQISPHFIFNILNNITALIRMKSEQAEPTIIQLSALLQYMLYDTREEKVLLTTEVSYLKTYIELQQQRFGDRVQIHQDIALENNWAEIEPMLLIPFVENAFKHGSGYLQHPEIDIHLITKSGRLIFEISNRYDPVSTEIKDRVSGIGLSNVQRRIELLYQNRSSFFIHRDQDTFTVHLELELGPAKQ